MVAEMLPPKLGVLGYFRPDALYCSGYSSMSLQGDIDVFGIILKPFPCYLPPGCSILWPCCPKWWYPCSKSSKLCSKKHHASDLLHIQHTHRLYIRLLACEIFCCILHLLFSYAHFCKRHLVATKPRNTNLVSWFDLYVRDTILPQMVDCCVCYGVCEDNKLVLA